MNRTQSQVLYQKLCEVIPGGVSSPVRSGKEVGGLPVIIQKAFQDCMVDVDGNAFIDYCGSWGALIHGHAHPVIQLAVQKRIGQGTSFGTTTPIEEALARKIVTLMPSIETLRFVSSGTEALMSAIRLARGFTKRDAIIKFSGNYHGHADLFLVQAGSGVTSLTASTSSGIPQEVIQHTYSLPYNDIEAFLTLFRKEGEKIAAVVLEPIAGNMGVVPSTPQFLKVLREETLKTGTLLLFDEVITGFRVSLGGAQQLYNIKPDLTCLGKIMGGGFSAAAFGGRREIMSCLAPLGSVYQAGTLSGNPVAMEAGLQALQLLEKPGFYEELERKTRLLTDPIQERIRELELPACLQRVGSMFTLFFGVQSLSNREEGKQLNTAAYSRLFHFLLAQGIYIPPSPYETWFVSDAHTEPHLHLTKDTLLTFLEKHLVSQKEYVTV